MSIKSAPYYWLECDRPFCSLKSTEGGDFSAWEDADSAQDDAENGNWWIGDNGDHYCSDHVPKCGSCGGILEYDGTCYEQDEHEKEATSE